MVQMRCFRYDCYFKTSVAKVLVYIDTHDITYYVHIQETGASMTRSMTRSDAMRVMIVMRMMKMRKKMDSKGKCTNYATSDSIERVGSFE